MTSAVAAPPVLLTRAEAARTLAICERTLIRKTVPDGPIPVVRIGRAVRYRPIDLEAFAAGLLVDAGAAKRPR